MVLGWSLLPPEVGNMAAFLLLGSLSALLFSIAKAGFGGSAGLLAVPIMIYACGSDNAVLATGLMLPLLIAADYAALPGWWGKWDLRAVMRLVPGTLVGVAVGGVLLWRLGRLGAEKTTNAWLTLAIGVIAIGFVALQLARSLARRPLEFRPVFWQEAIIGAAAGLTSTLSHAAGPIIVMILLPQGMAKGRYVATTVLYFWIANQVKLVPYFVLGLINPVSLQAGLVLLPAVAAGTALGIFLHHRVSQRHFAFVVYALLAIAGTDLIVKASKALGLY